MNQNSTQATLKTIAETAGCSVNTVSLALRGSNRISEATRNKIEKIAEKAGYVPNLAARNLITSRSGMIGVYTRALYDAVRVELVNHLFSHLHTAEYRPLLGLGYRKSDPWHTSPWIKTFQAMNIEALVIITEDMRQLPSFTGKLPIILLNCQPNTLLKCDYIALDRAEAANLGIKHLLSRGHKKILIATKSSQNSVFTQGCRDTLEDSGYPGQSNNFFSISHENEIPDLMSYIQETKPSAVIFGDSGLAAIFIKQLGRKKIKVPQDIAVIAYYYFPGADLLTPSLTTIEQPIDILAQKAVEVVNNRLSNPDSKHEHIVLKHTLVVRESG